MEKLGLNPPDGNAGSSDSNAVLKQLNTMWNAWGIDEGLVYAVLPFTGNLVTATASYTIGTGGAFNTARPARIYKAFFVSGTNRNELEIVEYGRYSSHNDLSASASTPDELYPDFNVDSSGFAKLYLWPVPTFGSGTPTLEIEIAATFSTWTLVANYNIPQGYQDAIEWTLAFRCLSTFGSAVQQQVAQTVAMEATKAEARIRAMNAVNRKLSPAAMQAPGSAPAPVAGA